MTIASGTHLDASHAIGLRDALGRPLRDLRISVTDRCNLRCRYCMPREVFGADFAFLPRAELLTFEEIARVAARFAAAGVTKVRLTGGEPTLRAGLPRLIEMLRAIPGLTIAMTTNGTLLAQLAPQLAAAGLHRVTVSLDSLDDDIFRAMNDVGLPVGAVLDGIDAAAAVGLPVKVNAVVRRGVNDHTLLDLAERFRGTPHVLRFIEFMDVGTTNGWRLDDVVPSEGVRASIAQRWPLEPIAPETPGEVAQRYRYADGAGEVGFISSVTSPFCASCTRMRLSADGRLYGCLFAASGVDLRGPLRAGATDDEVDAIVASTWRDRRDRYSAERSEATRAARPRIEMSYIGG